MFSNTFIQDLINYRNSSKVVTAITFASCGLCFISAITIPSGLTKVCITVLGMLSSYAGIVISQQFSNLNIRLEDLQLTSRATSKELIAGYFKDNSIEVNIPNLPVQDTDVITNIVDYWQQQEKHLAIIGGTGDGKSFTMKLFINSLQHEYSITAYDVDFAKDDYDSCVNVKYQYGDIEESFNNDMEELEIRIAQRRELGKKYVPDKKLIVGEEMPALADECDSLGAWMKKMSKRGRKVGMFIAAIAQNDTADNFALKGDYSILKANFCLLYLGSKAKARAKQLKNPALQEWLEGASKGKGLIDDKPCIIAATPYQPANINPPNTEEIADAKIAGSTAGSQLEVPEGAIFGASNIELSEENKLIYGRILISEGYSKNSVIKLLWDITGGRKYSELARLLDN